MACRNGVEVAGWGVDQEIRVPFLAYSVSAFQWQKINEVFRHPRLVLGVGSAHKRPLAAHGVAMGLNLENGQQSCHFIAEWYVKPQQTN